MAASGDWYKISSTTYINFDVVSGWVDDGTTITGYTAGVANYALTGADRQRVIDILSVSGKCES